MKNTFELLTLLFAFTVFSGFLAQAGEKNNPLLGEWVYEVSDAPYGYERGSLIFSEKDGLTSCTIKLETGELTANDLKIEKNKISFTTAVEGNPINVELTREKNKLSGKVDSPDGPKKLTAVKK